MGDPLAQQDPKEGEGYTSVPGIEPGGKALSPEIWNAEWQSGDGQILKTEIKDASKGIVQLTVIKEIASNPQPDAQDDMKKLLAPPASGATGLLDAAPGAQNAAAPAQGDDGPKSFKVIVCSLGPDAIASMLPDADSPYYGFGRVHIDRNHLLVYLPDPDMFSDLIKRKKIAGTLEKDKDGKLTGSSFLEGLTWKDCQRLQKDGFNPRLLFQKDPALVLIRSAVPAKP